MKSAKNSTLVFASALIILAGIYSFKIIKKDFLNQTELSDAYIAKMDKIVREKTKLLEIRCLSFNGKDVSFPLKVIDVAANDVLKIFRKLKEMNFPIYALSCYAPRTTIRKQKLSLHAYASAIDLNYLVNPYYDVIERTMIPTRRNDKLEDRKIIEQELRSIQTPEEEIQVILKTVIQDEESDDRFLNRGIVRKGMITPEVVKIFKKHGFNIWGGNWRRPLDYMHFQIPRALAEQLLNSDLESRRKLWEKHKKNCQ